MSWGGGGGWCCIVFDIDGMLFEYFMNVFVNKNKNTFYNFFFSFHVFFARYAISNILEFTIFLFSHFMLSSAQK